MEFDAVQRKIGEVILIGEHVIPRYQRPYAWDSENVRDLWSDLRSAPPDGHFLGNMVVHPSGQDQWDLVDGQQRLTTIMIALRALRDAYDKIGQNGRSKGLSHYLQRVNLAGEKAFRLQYRTDSGFLHIGIFSEPTEVILDQAPKSESERAQCAAYEQLSQLIDGDVDGHPEPLARLDEIRDQFIGATVVYVRVDDRKNAFTIFETLNDRGKSLSQLDLVKNQVISSIPQGAARQEESLWDDTLRMIDASNWSKVKAEDFLGYAWNSTGHQEDDEIVAVNRIRRSVDSYLKSGDGAEKQAREFISFFHRTAEIFAHFDACLAAPNGKHWEAVTPKGNWRKDKFEEIDRALYGCLVPGSNLPLNLLFSLLRNYIYREEDKTLRKQTLVSFLEAIERLQFRWSISQRPSTSTIRRAYRKAAYAIDSAESELQARQALEAFKVDANSLMPTDTQFREGLKKITYFTQRPQDVHRARHTLSRIDEKWGHSRLPRTGAMTLEHIEPQGGKSIYSRQNYWIGKLGNLMLLPASVNSTLPSTFSEKASTLAEYANPQDHILLSQASAHEWGNSVANERMDALLDVAVEVWPRTI